EKRRMNREADVLQQRIEILTFERRGFDPNEGVGRDKQVQKKCDGDPGLHRQYVGLEPLRKIAPEQRDRRAEYDENESPQEHRALVVPPYAGDLVDERFRGVRILD